jgi:hypothetical protein
MRHEVDSTSRRRRRLLDARLRVEDEPDLEALVTGEPHDGRKVVAHLEVDADAVGAGLAELRDMALRRFHHQVAVEPRPRVVDERSDRLEDDRAHRDRRDEMAVADVEVEDAGPGAKQLFHLFAEAGEVRRVSDGCTSTFQSTPVR